MMIPIGFANAVDCIPITTGSYTHYECDGKKVTGSYRTGAEISEFSIHEDKVTWRLTYNSSSETTTKYYMNSITEPRFYPIEVTQEAEIDFFNNDTIEEFNVINGRAIWKYEDARIRNCGSSCNSTTAYYEMCFDEALKYYPRINRITPRAVFNNVSKEKISNFIVWKNTAFWTFEQPPQKSYSDNKTLEDCFKEPVIEEPQTPSTPTAVANGNNITVNWNDVSGANSYALAIQFNSNDWTGYDYVTNGSSKTWTNMPPGDRRYRVKACNGEICSEASGVSNYVTILPSGAPQTPNKPSATVHGNTITVDWNTISNASYYMVSIQFNNGTWTDFKYRSDISQISWTGLGSGTRKYRVKACTSEKCSAASGISNPVNN